MAIILIGTVANPGTHMYSCETKYPRQKRLLVACKNRRNNCMKIFQIRRYPVDIKVTGDNIHTSDNDTHVEVG